MTEALTSVLRKPEGIVDRSGQSRQKTLPTSQALLDTKPTRPEPKPVIQDITELYQSR